MDKAPLSPNFAARLTPHYSIVAVPLFTSEAADRVVAVRVRTAVTCPSAARTPARSPDEQPAPRWSPILLVDVQATSVRLPAVETRLALAAEGADRVDAVGVVAANLQTSMQQ